MSSRPVRRAPPRSAIAAAAAALLLTCCASFAQPFGPPPPDTRSPREAAPIDVTGQWVAIVNEDWRWRMVTPAKGDYASVPLNPEGRRIADLWEPSQDGDCEAYGAAALLRMPTRLRFTWVGDDVLRLEADAGDQTRLFRFDAAPGSGSRSLQGDSVAEWARPARRAGGPGLVLGAGGGPTPGGYLEVATTNLLPGWLRRNGVPYSEDAVVTEYFDRFPSTNGDEWLMVTTIVNDPKYLTAPYVTSSHFKRDTDESNWNPTPCGAP